MKKKILIVKGKSRYNVLREAADDIANGFENLGYEVDKLDLLDSAYNINNILGDYELIFSFQALLFDFIVNENYLYNYIDTPVFGLIVDHPLYHHGRCCAQLNKNSILGCIDRGHVKYVKKYYEGIRNVEFLPHAGFQPEKVVPYTKKTTDVFFSGTYTPINSIVQKINDLPEIYKKIALDLIDIMQSDYNISFSDALENYLNNINFEISKSEFTILLALLDPVDAYTRYSNRDKCIEELISNGISVTVAGKGWDCVTSPNKNNLKILSNEGLDIKKVVEIINQSKILLNSMPNFKEGTHERIYTAMNCNTICVTDSSKVIEEQFTNDKDIIIYDNKKITDLHHVISNLLNNNANAEIIANSGFKLAQENHKWENRASQILSICKQTQEHS